MSGGKRAEDKLNTIGIVVVGICGAVLVYVTIVALEAFYVNDTSELQTMADYGGTDTTAKSLKATQLGNIGEYASNPTTAGKEPTYRLKIERAKELVITPVTLPDGSKRIDPSALVPALGPLTPPEQCKLGLMGCPTVQPIFGRPVKFPEPPAAAPGTPPAAPTGATDGSAAGSASTPGTTVPLTPTGNGGATPAQPGSSGSGSNAP